jgi:hypothetical protein
MSYVLDWIHRFAMNVCLKARHPQANRQTLTPGSGSALLTRYLTQFLLPSSIFAGTDIACAFIRLISPSSRSIWFVSHSLG